MKLIRDEEAQKQQVSKMKLKKSSEHVSTWYDCIHSRESKSPSHVGGGRLKPHTCTHKELWTNTFSNNEQVISERIETVFIVQGAERTWINTPYIVVELLTN